MADTKATVAPCLPGAPRLRRFLPPAVPGKNLGDSPPTISHSFALDWKVTSTHQRCREDPDFAVSSRSGYESSQSNPPASTVMTASISGTTTPRTARSPTPATRLPKSKPDSARGLEREEALDRRSRSCWKRHVASGQVRGSRRPRRSDRTTTTISVSTVSGNANQIIAAPSAGTAAWAVASSTR
jgi:hypothetical protein